MLGNFTPNYLSIDSFYIDTYFIIVIFAKNVIL